MRTLIIAVIALGAIASAAAAQTPTPSVGSDQVYWVITFTVDQDGRVQADRKKTVAATEKEPGALAYEYNVGNDNKTVDLYERYTNAHAAVVHVTENFGPNFSKEFLALAKPTRFVVYTSSPTDELKNALADFHPIYMTPLEGFTK